MRNYDTKLFT